MQVVLDTNVLLQARAAGHAYHAILRAWMEGRFDWVVSTEILLEYQEIITRRTGAARWAVLEQLLGMSRNVRLMDSTFRFAVIKEDPDDNKFCDCAIAAGADYIITEDRHFEVMKSSGYGPQVINPMIFISQYPSGR